MIDPRQIENLLSNTKMKSISEIVNFIVEHISKLINLQSIHELVTKVTQLQRPRGLDFIMIEQVKTLVEAMIDQRQINIRHDYEQFFTENFSNVLQVQYNNGEQNTRRSLNQLDFLNYANQTRRQSLLQNDLKQSKNYRFQAALTQVSEIKEKLMKKIDRKDFNELKNTVSREIVDKISVGQTQKIMSKFQCQVFEKINQSNLEFQQIQYNIKKTINEELLSLKKQIGTGKLKELKTAVQKIQKKLKKNKQQEQQKKKELYKMQQNIETTRNEIKVYGEQKYQQLYVQCKDLFKDMEEIISDSRTSNKNEKQFNLQIGIWSSIGLNTKNSHMMWQKQHCNTNCDNFYFESRKTKIMIIQPGYYEINCWIFNGDSKSKHIQPILCLNSQSILRMENKNHSCTNIGTAELRQMIFIGESRSQISIKMEEESKYSMGIFKIFKIV